MELIDNATGKTVVATEASTADRFSGQYLLTGVTHTTVGVAPGEKLRVNVANPMGERDLQWRRCNCSMRSAIC